MPTAHTVWLNTQNNLWFGSQISTICCEPTGAPSPPPPNLPPGALPVHPAGKLPSPRPFVPPYLQILVQRDRATLQRADKPCNATWCRETARCHVVQRDRATLRGAEGPRDTTACRGTARRHVVQRDRAVFLHALASRGPSARRDVARSLCTTWHRTVYLHAVASRGPSARRDVGRFLCTLFGLWPLLL